MDSDFVRQARSCTPKNCLFFHIGRNLDAMIELKDGSLMTVPTSGRSTSPDGGLTWTDTEIRARCRREPDSVWVSTPRTVEVGWHRWFLP